MSPPAGPLHVQTNLRDAPEDELGEQVTNSQPVGHVSRVSHPRLDVGRCLRLSLVSRFMQLLTAQLLQSDSAAPSGLQFHVLDVYMTELAAVGSAEVQARAHTHTPDITSKT